MAVPKKRTSVSRRGLRHAGQHHKAKKVNSVVCPNCGDYTLPHRVCSSCGTYKGHEVIKMKAVEENEAEETTSES